QACGLERALDLYTVPNDRHAGDFAIAGWIVACRQGSLDERHGYRVRTSLDRDCHVRHFGDNLFTACRTITVGERQVFRPAYFPARHFGTVNEKDHGCGGFHAARIQTGVYAVAIDEAETVFPVGR